MIRIIPINRNGISRVIEYDNIDDKRALQAMLGIIKSGRLKLEPIMEYTYFGTDCVKQYGDITHYFNAKGQEVAHSGLQCLNSNRKFVMFEKPRNWEHEIKKAYEIVNIIKQTEEINLEVSQSSKNLLL